MFFLFLFLFACRLGVPPQNNGYFVQKIHSQGVEFGVDQMLRKSFVRALSHRQATGGSPVQLDYLKIEEKLIYTRDKKQIWQVEMRLQIRTIKDRQLVVFDKESYSFQSPIQFADSRRQAYVRLSNRLSERAVTWLLFAPGVSHDE